MPPSDEPQNSASGLRKRVVLKEIGSFTLTWGEKEIKSFASPGNRQSEVCNAKVLSEEGLFLERGCLPNLGRDGEDHNKVSEEGWSQMRPVLRGGGGLGEGERAGEEHRQTVRD